MKCAQCGNEVFRISARNGGPSFYCTRCGLAHPLSLAEVGGKRPADLAQSDLGKPEAA